jgi:hypothetical protein
MPPGSANLLVSIMAAMIYGLNPASLYVSILDR